MSAASRSGARVRLPWFRIGLLIGLIALSVAGVVWFRDEITLANLARYERQMRQFYLAHRWATYALVVLLYTAVSGISIPGSGTALTLFFGWFFGFWRAVVLVSFGSTAGATLAFLVSRYLLHDLVSERFPARLRLVQQAFDRDGAWYLLTLRLLPIVPYFVINVVMGLTNIRTRTFWWASQLGMLPATCVYTYAAASAPSLEELAQQGIGTIFTPQLFLALTLLAVFPLAARAFVRWIFSLRQAIRRSDDEAA